MKKKKRTISIPCTRDKISVISSLLAVRVGSNDVDVECFEESGGLSTNVSVALSPPPISSRYMRTKAKYGDRSEERRDRGTYQKTSGLSIQ